MGAGEGLGVGYGRVSSGDETVHLWARSLSNRPRNRALPERKRVGTPPHGSLRPGGRELVQDPASKAHRDCLYFVSAAGIECARTTWQLVDKTKGRSSMNKRDQHVVPSTGGGWAVRRTGSERASKVFPTQQEAIKHARQRAMKEEAELYIHRKDGTIRNRDSYGRDPFPPKDKK